MQFVHGGGEKPCNSCMLAGRGPAIHTWGQGGAMKFTHGGGEEPCNACMQADSAD